MWFYCSKTIHFDAKRPGRWRVYGHRGGARSVYLSTKAAPSHRVVEVEVEVVEVEVVAPGAGVPGHQVGARCSKSIHFEDGGVRGGPTAEGTWPPARAKSV